MCFLHSSILFHPNNMSKNRRLWNSDTREVPYSLCDCLKGRGNLERNLVYKHLLPPSFSSILRPQQDFLCKWFIWHGMWEILFLKYIRTDFNVDCFASLLLVFSTSLFEPASFCEMCAWGKGGRRAFWTLLWFIAAYEENGRAQWYCIIRRHRCLCSGYTFSSIFLPTVF